MHRLLERQISRHFGKDFLADETLQSFFNVVDSYYHDVEREHRLLQNALTVNTRELNAANEHLRAQNAEMTRTLLDTLSDGVYATNAEGQITFMNSAAEHVLGWKERELIGKLMHENAQQHLPDGSLYLAEQLPQFRVMRSGEPIECQSHFPAKNGILIPVECRSRPIIQEGVIIGALVSFQDMRLRQQTEDNLRVAYENLRATLSELEFQNFALDQHTIVSIADLSGNIIYANSKFSEISQYSSEELLGKNHRILNSGYHPREFFTQMWQTISSGQIWQGEIRNRRKDGSYYWVVSTIVPYKDGWGKPQRYISIRNDITERKQNELAIRTAQERLNLALEGSNMALWDWDIVQDQVYMSDRWSLMMGDEQKEITVSSSQLLDKVHPQDQSNLVANLEAALKGDSLIYSAEFRVARTDGEWAWVQTHGKVAERDESGNPLRMTGTNEDISERKRAEDALYKSEVKLRTLYDSTSDAVMLLDDKGFFDCNIAALSTFGCQSKKEFCSYHPAQLSPEIQPAGMDSMTLAGRQIDIAMKNGSNRFEWVHQRADNAQRFDAEVLLNTMFLDGKTVLQATVRDITQRKQVEAALRHAKEAAEQASKIKSDFLANMSHEIRTPMNGIIGMTELALDSELLPEQREHLGMVKSSADALLHIINDILDFSKIESGKMDIESIEFSLQHMLRDTLKTLAVRAQQKKLELLLRIAPDVTDRLMGDPGRMRQVIINLVGNAIKFTAKGEVVVDVQCEKHLSEHQARLRFSVRDTGIGIPIEKFQTIFDSFSQADTSTTRKYGGTGLGLTISAQLIELMGGHIGVESELGKGSTFHFTLDMQIVVGNAAAQYRLTEQVAGMSVLVVDDNATNCTLLHEMLCHWKMLPTIVSSGAEALAELERASDSGHPYALAIVDVEMPGMDGFTLAERINEHPEQVRATVMMITSQGERGHAARCRELGVASYLLKPVSQSELLDAIMLSALGMPVHQDTPLITRHSLRENRSKLRLLLAEDNLVNQSLAIRLLEKLGHQVTLANNGVEAVQHWQAGQFDAILMDVDMPEMNGYEATERIRKLEQEKGTHIPIVAMTAHAMQGAREECFSHGMDGYLTKPIDTEELWRALDNLAKSAKSETKASTKAEVKTEAIVAARLAVADFDKARQFMDNSRELYDEIVKLFFTDTAPHLQNIKEGLISGDVKSIQHSAHTIKGIVSIFAAERSIQAAEMVGKLAEDNKLQAAVIELEAALDELTLAVQAYRWR